MGRHKKYFTEEERKAAQREYHKQYYQNNKEKIAKRQYEYYQNNKEKYIEYQSKYQAEYYQNNKEKIAAQQAEYYQNNKEKYAEYYQNNKEKIAGTGRKALLKHVADNLQRFNTVGPLCEGSLPNEYDLWLGFDEDDVRFIDAVAIIDALNQLFESFKKK